MPASRRPVAEGSVAKEDGSSSGMLNDADRNAILRRMRRIEGQARGVQRMVEEGQRCEDIMIQIEAMRAALQRVKVTLSVCHVKQTALLKTASADLADDLARAIQKTLEQI